jgi:GcrA cell cycle regulator
MPQPRWAWTDELIAELRKLREASYNAREIAILLGHGLSRNAVIGKAWRLKIQWGPSARSPTQPERPVARATIPRPDPPRPPKPPAPPPPPQPPPQPATGPRMRNLRLVDLGPQHCRWPLGGLYETATHFCAADRFDGYPYCPHHTRMAHPRPDRRTV